MPATVTPFLAAPDPAANPTSVAALVTLLNQLFATVNVDGGPFTPYVISSTTPAVSDNDKVWVKTDSNGRPLEFRLFYNGTWRRFYSGKIGEVSMFTGNPATYFDNTGLGIVGLDWDGFALMNGQNGTTDISDKFIVSAHLNDLSIGYSGGAWKTNVTGSTLSTGGSTTYAIKNTDLPNMTINIVGRKYSAGAATGIKSVLVDGDWAGGDLVDSIQTHTISFGSNPSGSPPVQQTTVPTTPPFYAMAFCQWIGYT